MEMRTTQTAPQSKDTASQVELYMSFELADKTWKLTFGPMDLPAKVSLRRSPGEPAPRQLSLAAGGFRVS
jgi:hypothetical protein